MTTRPPSLFAQKMQKLRELRSKTSIERCVPAHSSPGNNQFLFDMSELKIEERKYSPRESLQQTELSSCDQGLKMKSDIRTETSLMDIDEPLRTSSNRDFNLMNPLSELKGSGIHMEKEEHEKLKWMEDLPSITTPLPDTLYNARFDFEGDLMPYVEENKSTCHKGLYHHGDEPQRPGYAIEELYQLTRSSLPGQRVFALNTIAAILEKEYILSCSLETELLKQLLDSGIFLIIRFSLDERLKPVYLAALRAMSALLWRPFDMHYLSDMVGLFGDMKLPSLEVINETLEQENLKEVKDIDLITLDVIRGCLRTDLIQRLRFIMDDPLLEVDHYLHIVKCLTRISYHSDEVVNAIISCPSLLEILFLNCQYSPRCGKLYTAKLMILYRVICCRSRTFAVALTSRLKLFPFLLSTVSDPVTKTTTASQCIQLWHVLLSYHIGIESVSEISSSLGSLVHRLLALQIDNLDKGLIVLANALLSSLIFLFEHFQESVQFLIPTIERLSCQWINVMANEKEVPREFMKLVSNSIFLLSRFSSELPSFYATINWCFQRQDVRGRLISALPSCSFLLEADKKNYVPCLPSLCIPHNCLNSNNSLTLLHSLVKCARKNSHFEPIGLFINEILSKYVTHILDKNLNEVASMWPARYEINFLYDFLFLCKNLNWNNDEIPKLVLKLAFTLLRIIHMDNVFMVKSILNEIIFDDDLHAKANLVEDGNRKHNLAEVKSLFLNRLSLPVDNNDSLMSSRKGTECIMPTDWFYVPILEISNKFADKEIKCGPETTGIMKAVLRWIHLIECMAENIRFKMSLSTRFCRVCCVFFCGDVFLDVQVELLDILKEIVKHNEKLEFRKPIPGISSFYDFFRELCEQYAGSSYGNHVFAAYLLVPLQQIHSVVLKQYLWNEQTVIFRFLTLTPKELPVPFENYLEPCETNIHLIETYLNTLVIGRVLEKSCPIMYSIALHHVAKFIRLYGEETVAKRLKQKIDNIGNEDIKNKILQYET